MSERKIIVTVDALGKPTIEAVGFNGVGCSDATKAIEMALAGGDGEVSRVLKPEWHNSTDTEQEEHNHMTW